MNWISYPETTVEIIPTMSQWRAIEGNGLDLRKCTALEASPSTLFHWKFNDDDVVCTVIETDGSMKVESRDFAQGSGWKSIVGDEGRCYACDYLDDDLTEYAHEGETVMLCKECLA